MRGDIDPILRAAKGIVAEWFIENGKLCPFKADVYEDLYYATCHGQAWYLLKFYPAYYAEYYLMYGELLRLGLARPKIASLGCGSFVDAVSARRVYGENMSYTGYDKNEWRIKAGDFQCECAEISTIAAFHADTNVFCFPRSIGDLMGCYEAIGRAIVASNLTSESIYVCASLRVANEGNSVATDEASLNRLVGCIGGYVRTDDYLYHPAIDQSENQKTIAVKIPGWWHECPNYAKGLLRTCRQQNACQEACEDAIKPVATLMLKKLAFKIVRLVRG